MARKDDVHYLKGSHGVLPIQGDDKVARKLAMIFEVRCMGVPVMEAARRYGYTIPRYYQVHTSYMTEGTEGLVDKKPGPKGNSIRTAEVVNQIIRHRFLDPDASPAVITQRLKQTGYSVSQRSVERTITEYGLQKKTPRVKS